MESHTFPQPLEAAGLLDAEATLLQLARGFSLQDLDKRPGECPVLSADARYRALIEQIPAVVFLAHMDGGLGEAYVSPQIETILGFTQEEWLMNPILLFRQLHPGDKDRWSAESAQLFVTGEPLKSTYRVLARHGSTVWFRCEVRMVLTEDGRPWFMHGVAFDVTEMKRAEESLEQAHAELEARVAERTAQLAHSNAELARAMEEAQAANRAKSNFLATISHEIRTLMNGVLGMTQVLLGTPLSQEQRDAAQTIQQSADALLTIINDILDLSKIEAGKLELDSTGFRLSDLVDAVLRLLAPRARSAGLTLLAKPPLPRRVVTGDPARLRQILINVVGNAIKFTEQGEVTVAVENAHSGRAVFQDGPSLWHFTVEDTGIGIPLDRQSAIFDAFTQVDSSVLRRFGGTGLGLTISARLVEAMGGRIWLESEPGRGTKVHFTVELGPAAEARAPEGHRRAGAQRNGGSVKDWPGPSLRILLVEDNAVNQKVAGALLRKRGHRVTIASNGQEGLHAVSQESFDVILMDIQMPVLDGWETTAAIRASERESGGHVPIIAMTAHAFREDIERCLNAGMDGFISKPFQMDALVKELDRVRKMPVAPG